MHARKGFTLVELLIYLGIFAIIGILGGQVVSAVLKTRASVSRSNEVQLNTSRVLQQIVDRVHTAVTINGASTTLSLRMADSSKNATIISLSATGTVTIAEGTSLPVPMTPSTVNVTALTFTLLTNPDPSTSSVQIAITGAYNNVGVADTNTVYSLRTTALPL
jgi:type II secretory pathway pseudopilin PulG